MDPPERRRRADADGPGSCHADTAAPQLARDLGPRWRGHPGPVLQREPPAEEWRAVARRSGGRDQRGRPVSGDQHRAARHRHQEVLENREWAMMSGDPLAHAPRLRKAPLAGGPAKPVIVQFGKGDRNIPNPTETALLRAGELADRATFYRHDLAFAEDPTLDRNPHQFLIRVVGNPGERRIALGYQSQIAAFFASDGEVIIHPEPARFFETPIAGSLPERLN